MDYNDQLRKKHRLLGNTTDIDRLLHLAARNGDVSVVAMLIQRGFQLNRSLNGNTPLWCAVDEGRADVVRLLLQYGANIRIPELTWHAMEASIRKGYVNVVEELINNENMIKPDRKSKNSSHLELAINSIQPRYFELKSLQPSITQAEVERRFAVVVRLLFENGWNKFGSGVSFLHPARLAIR